MQADQKNRSYQKSYQLKKVKVSQKIRLQNWLFLFSSLEHITWKQQAVSCQNEIHVGIHDPLF
ncbi:hypothetical protein PG1C_06205 [Rugosibacter aromaticivorans]|uniref:Uncharacterized protein n=1 Tax=Rugosibacter aromaticivorans TaxID=1565605 RepID=A0A0C5JLC3_9PROT|nr:hypothetical protein PG1C_06205 [Rugosibacter aromaticivorans]